MAKPLEHTPRHYTTRRGFAVLMGLLVLVLYFIWAAYGAAPTSLRFLSETQTESMEGGGHGAGATGMTPEKFTELTENFIEKFRLPDGSVKPRREGPGSQAAQHGEKGPGEMRHDEATDGGERAAAHSETAMPKSGDMATDGHPSEAATMTAASAVKAGEGEKGHAENESAEPIDVYIMALRFSYEPQVLRLEQGVPYRFRLMSMDVNHGASIHTGFAGHIMRRPARAMVDMVMTFTLPGEYMIYCTVYCGLGHDVMKGKIIVE